MSKCLHFQLNCLARLKIKLVKKGVKYLKFAISKQIKERLQNQNKFLINQLDKYNFTNFKI